MHDSYSYLVSYFERFFADYRALPIARKVAAIEQLVAPAAIDLELHGGSDKDWLVTHVRDRLSKIALTEI